MSDVVGVTRRIGELVGVFEPERVLPMNGWNIWNISNYLKNIYKKHIDNRTHQSSNTGTYWNSLEHLSIACSKDVPPDLLPEIHSKAIRIKAYSQIVKKAVLACSG